MPFNSNKNKKKKITNFFILHTNQHMNIHTRAHMKIQTQGIAWCSHLTLCTQSNDWHSATIWTQFCNTFSAWLMLNLHTSQTLNSTHTSAHFSYAQFNFTQLTEERDREKKPNFSFQRKCTGSYETMHAQPN